MYALADLHLPEIPVRVHRAVLDQVRHDTLATCENLGIVREDRMSPRKYLAGRFELLAGLCYPDADVDALTLCNDFLVYLFYVDDQAEEDERFGKHPESLQCYFERHLHALRQGTESERDDPAGHLLASIRRRLLPRASERWLARFACDVSDYLLRGTLVGARHWTAGTVPSFEAYVEQRAWDSAVQCTQDLLEVAGAGELPAEVCERPEWAELRRRCTNIVAFTNDLVSYPKEVRHHSSPNNLVHVIATHEGRSVDAAIERVIEIVNQEVARFEEVARRLPTSFGAEVDARVGRYLAGQRAWMVGNLLWSLATGRYVDAESPFAELRRPASSQAPLQYRGFAV
jgi:hypothetical protein